MLYSAYSQNFSGSPCSTRSRKDPVSCLNAMVVGVSGAGKTSFVRTLCERIKTSTIQGTFKESRPMALKGALHATEELYSVSMHIEDNGQRTAFTLIDTPGFTNGFAVDHQLRHICKYIDHQFERTLSEESKLKRDTKALDTHIHVCLYFIDISRNGLSDIDRYIINLLSTRVNVLPVIGKADTLSTNQREQMKLSLKKDVFDVLQIPVYGYISMNDDNSENESSNKAQGAANGKSKPGSASSSNAARVIEMLQESVDEDNDDDALAMIKYLEQMPFSVFSYEEDNKTGRPLTMQPNAKSGTVHQLDSVNYIEPEEKEPSSPKPVQDKVTSGLSPARTRSSRVSKPVLGRRYPWAVVQCFNPEHCDFEALVNMLLYEHRDMLRIDTYERFYEQYRTDQLLSRKVSNIMSISSKSVDKQLI